MPIWPILSGQYGPYWHAGVRYLEIERFEILNHSIFYHGIVQRCPGQHRKTNSESDKVSVIPTIYSHADDSYSYTHLAAERASVASSLVFSSLVSLGLPSFAVLNQLAPGYFVTKLSFGKVQDRFPRPWKLMV